MTSLHRRWGDVVLTSCAFREWLKVRKSVTCCISLVSNHANESLDFDEMWKPFESATDPWTFFTVLFTENLSPCPAYDNQESLSVPYFISVPRNATLYKRHDVASTLIRRCINTGTKKKTIINGLWLVPSFIIYNSCPGQWSFKLVYCWYYQWPKGYIL